MDDFTNDGMRRFLQRLLQTDAGKAIVAEDNQATAADRRRGVKRLADLDVECAALGKRARDAHEGAQKDYQAAKTAFEKTAIALGDVTRFYNAELLRATAEQTDIERMLEESCPAEITTLIEQIEAGIEEVRSNDISSMQIGTRTPLVGGQFRLYATNGPSITAFLEIAIALRTEALALRHTADEPPVMLKKVSALRERFEKSLSTITIEEVAVQSPVFVSEARR